MNKRAAIEAVPLTAPALCVLFSGDDIISRNLARSELLKKINAEHTDVSSERFERGDEKFLEFAERCMTPSLFSSTRIVSVRHAETLDATETGQLESLIMHDLPDVYLIVEIDESDDDSDSKKSTGRASGGPAIKKMFVKMAKHLPDRFFVHDFPKPREYETAKWLTANVSRLFKRSINLPDAEYLIDLIGNDFNSIYSELQKIDLHLEDTENITRESIDAVVGSIRDYSPFELANAVAAKNMVRTLDVIDGLFSGSFSSAALTPVLFRQFWAMFKISLFCAENPQKIKAFLQGGYQAQNTIGVEIGIAAGLLTAAQAKSVYPKIIKSNIVQHARNFSAREYLTVFSLLKDHDVGTKTGKVEDSKKSIQWLCYKIINAQIAAA